MVATIEREWDDAADTAQLSQDERTLLRRSAVLHPSIHYTD
jgi:hypothetical protein